MNETSLNIDSTFNPQETVFPMETIIFVDVIKKAIDESDISTSESGLDLLCNKYGISVDVEDNLSIIKHILINEVQKN